MHASLDPDATVGQLLAQLKDQMRREEFRLCCERGRLVLLGASPRSWPLNDAYQRFMLTAEVRSMAGSGGPLQFSVVW